MQSYVTPHSLGSKPVLADVGPRHLLLTELCTWTHSAIVVWSHRRVWECKVCRSFSCSRFFVMRGAIHLPFPLRMRRVNSEILWSGYETTSDAGTPAFYARDTSSFVFL